MYLRSSKQKLTPPYPTRKKGRKEMTTKSNTPSSTSTKATPNTTTASPDLNAKLLQLAHDFTTMLKEERDGIARFNEIEDEIKATPAGTPEMSSLRKQRTQSILQVRNSRKAQEAIKFQMLKI